MSLTLAEIVKYEDRLRHEIMERECVLAALKVMHDYAATGRGHSAIDLAPLVSALAPSALALAEAAPNAAPAPAALPPPPRVPPYMHPELQKISKLYGSDTAVVLWAIRRMTSDYTLKDIEALLKREGCPLKGAQISVVLTRLKGRGEIEEIRRGTGPNPATFRKPAMTETEDASTNGATLPTSPEHEDGDPHLLVAAAA